MFLTALHEQGAFIVPDGYARAMKIGVVIATSGSGSGESGNGHRCRLSGFRSYGGHYR